ncbi:hypothetical protein ACVWXM_001749 [Bradyrhizobium sp. GM7.3]
MERGRTKDGPWSACAVGTNRGHASMIAITINPEQTTAETNASICSERKAVMAADPTSPPMLN